MYRAVGTRIRAAIRVVGVIGSDVGRRIMRQTIRGRGVVEVAIRRVATQAFLDIRRPGPAPNATVSDEVGVATHATDRVALGIGQGRVGDLRLEPVHLQRELVLQGGDGDAVFRRLAVSVRDRRAGHAQPGGIGLEVLRTVSKHADRRVPGELGGEELGQVINRAPGLALAADICARLDVIRIVQAGEPRVRIGLGIGLEVRDDVLAPAEGWDQVPIQQVALPGEAGGDVAEAGTIRGFDQ